MAHIPGPRSVLAEFPDTMDSWQIHDNARFAVPRLIAYRVGGMPPGIADSSAWETLKEQG